jgi:hypothetical protein
LRELVGSAMLVETTNHNLDELSLFKASQALDGSTSVADTVEHGDSALAVLDDIRLLSEAEILEFDPSTVVLVEYDLVTENGGILSGCGLVPSYFNVSADKLDCSHLDSGGTGSGGKCEYLREVSNATDVASADSESVFQSFSESIDRCSVLEKSVITAVSQRPGDLVGGVSLIPLDLKLSVRISVGPGEIEGSDGGESKLLEESHLCGLSTDFASSNVGHGNSRPSSLVVSSASSENALSKGEVEGSLSPGSHGDSAGECKVKSVLGALGDGVELEVLTTNCDLVFADGRSLAIRSCPGESHSTRRSGHTTLDRVHLSRSGSIIESKDIRIRSESASIAGSHSETVLLRNVYFGNNDTDTAGLCLGLNSGEGAIRVSGVPEEFVLEDIPSTSRSGVEEFLVADLKVCAITF